MRLLAGGIERIAIRRRVVVAEVRPRLQRARRKTAVPEAQLDDLGGARKRSLGLVAMPPLDLEHHIGAELRMHQRGAGCDSRTRAHDRRQRLIVNHDGFSRVLGGKARLRNYRGDDIAHVMNGVPRKAGARRAVHRPSVAEPHGMHDSEFAMTRFVPVRGCEDRSTPGIAAARAISMARIRACACGLRTKTHHAVPGRWTSST